MQRLVVWVLLVVHGHSHGGLGFRPVGGLVVLARILVQPAPPVLTAEAVVAGAAAVDVAVLGAVERAVKVPHYVVVTPVETQWVGSSVRHQVTQLVRPPEARHPRITLESLFGLEDPD